MQAFNQFYQAIAQNDLSHWLESLPLQLKHWQQQNLHGEFARWQRLLSHLPDTQVTSVKLGDTIAIGPHDLISNGQTQHITHILKQFKPWRKGPYQIHNIEIDTEWRSDLKWNRLINHISQLNDRYVLDVGCGNGYHMWRMLGEQAKFVVGIDPSQLFLQQFLGIKHFYPAPNIHLLPLGIEQLPPLGAFDSLFSMGVLYHRRSPIDFLYQLSNQLKLGGELILETLVIEGKNDAILVPKDRYAKMPNVWFIPSVAALTIWLEKVGFSDIQLVSINKTTHLEQRRTPWIDGESLDSFLLPDDPNQTIEGYPAPLRAILVAKKSKKTQ